MKKAILINVIFSNGNWERCIASSTRHESKQHQGQFQLTRHSDIVAYSKFEDIFSREERTCLLYQYCSYLRRVIIRWPLFRSCWSTLTRQWPEWFIAFTTLQWFSLKFTYAYDKILSKKRYWHFVHEYVFLFAATSFKTQAEILMKVVKNRQWLHIRDFWQKWPNLPPYSWTVPQ